MLSAQNWFDNGAIAFRDEHKLCFILFAKEPLGVFRFWID